MKQITFITCLLFTGMVFSQNINIPDAVFLDKLIAAGVDTDGDGQISYNEALAITHLNVSSSSTSPQITDMEGIQHFTNLIELNCSGNLLTILNISPLTQLEILNCYNNQLTSLNITGLNQLKSLQASYNNIASINLTGLDQVESVRLNQNELTTIDLSGLDNLWVAWVSFNNLTDINITNLTSLERLWADNNQLTTIDFSTTPNLQGINISNNLLSVIDISNLSGLEYIACSYNFLENIDVENLNSLQLLYISDNLLTEIDASLAPSLSVLYCSSNPDLEYINIKNGVVSTSDPDMLDFGFYFYDLPNLKFICMDPGEEYALSQSGYDPSNVNVSTTNCTMSINDFAFDSIILYPNPIKDTFFISNTENIVAYRVFDVPGKQNVTSKNFESLQNQVLGLSPGYYFLELTSNENQKKVIQFLKL